MASLVAQMVKESACIVGDPGLIPGLEDTLERKWKPTPGFLPGNSMDRGAWIWI